MKIALYASVSKRDRRQDTENQLTQLREFVSAQNWTVVQVYVDRASVVRVARTRRLRRRARSKRAA